MDKLDPNTPISFQNGSETITVRHIGPSRSLKADGTPDVSATIHIQPEGGRVRRISVNEQEAADLGNNTPEGNAFESRLLGQMQAYLKEYADTPSTMPVLSYAQPQSAPSQQLASVSPTVAPPPPAPMN